MAKCDGKCVLLMAIAKAIGGMINDIIDGNNDNDGDKELVVMLRILIMIKKHNTSINVDYRSITDC